MSDRYWCNPHGDIFCNEKFFGKAYSLDHAKILAERLKQLEDVRLAAKAHVNNSSATNLLALVNALEDCEPKTAEQLLQERLDAADEAIANYEQIYSDGSCADSTNKYWETKTAHEKALESMS